MVTTSTNIQVDKMHEATLSNADGFTAFSFGGYNIRFKAPYSLERYTDVVKWEDGYLVVKAKYRHNAEPEEEYIDLKPILDGLYIDYDSFLKPISHGKITCQKETIFLFGRLIGLSMVEEMRKMLKNNGLASCLMSK